MPAAGQTRMRPARRHSRCVWSAETPAVPAAPPRAVLTRVDELQRKLRHVIVLRPQAEAIIANPISYGHVHLADHLGLPLHFLWTQPEMATRVTPRHHPEETGTARGCSCFSICRTAYAPSLVAAGRLCPHARHAGLCPPPGALPVREDVAGVAPQQERPRPAAGPHQPHVLRRHPLRHGDGRGG